MDKNLIIHHFCVILGFGTGLISGQCGLEIIQGTLIAEASNFYMHSRKILQQIRKVYTKSYDLVEKIYFLSYFIGRVFIIFQINIIKLKLNLSIKN
jgi:hypothetical protein